MAEIVINDELREKLCNLLGLAEHAANYRSIKIEFANGCINHEMKPTSGYISKPPQGLSSAGN